MPASRATGPKPKSTSSTSAASPGSAVSATFRPPSRPAPFATCGGPGIQGQVRISRPWRECAGAAGPDAGPAKAWTGAANAPGRYEAWNNPISASELVTARSIIGAQAARLLTGAEFTDEALKQAKRPVAISHPALRDPWPGRRAQAGMPGPAGAAHLVRTRPERWFPVGRPAHLQGNLRPAARRRSRHPVRLRHGRRGQRCSDARSGPGRRRRLRAGRPGSRLRRRGRAFGGGQPLAAAGQFRRNRAADQQHVQGARRNGHGHALRTGQRGLMDEAATSHPYYWSGFAVIGDGSRPVLRAR
jgi:hypothetical protein